MRRLLCIVSALILVVALVGWIASTRGDFGVERYHQGHADGRDDWLYIGDGQLVWHARRWQGDEWPGTRYEILHRAPWHTPDRRWLQWGGFAWEYGFIADPTYVVLGFQASWGTDMGNYIGHNRVLAIPLWFVALVAAIVPALSARAAYRRRRRSRAGQCLNCGYDLRATPDQCPECGLSRSTQSQWFATSRTLT